MTKHTPSPWKAGAMSVGTDEGEDSQPICCMIGEREYEEHVANARLMAAAPELLTALNDAATRLEFLTNWIENSYGGSNQDVELGRSYVREARTAITRAETERE